MTLEFRTSSYSNPGQSCVAVCLEDTRSRVRDTKDPNSETLGFSPEAFNAFVQTLKR